MKITPNQLRRLIREQTMPHMMPGDDEDDERTHTYNFMSATQGSPESEEAASALAVMFANDDYTAHVMDIARAFEGAGADEETATENAEWIVDTFGYTGERDDYDDDDMSADEYRDWHIHTEQPTPKRNAT
jgi:hypothetical protein